MTLFKEFLESIRKATQDDRLITIKIIGEERQGMGKSALAIKMFHALKRQKTDEQWK